MRELRLRGIAAVSEVSLSVLYKGECVGDYFADILVEDRLVIELKCAERLAVVSGILCKRPADCGPD
jgi:GxxExxY protein